MNKKSSAKFILSHSRQSGYDFGENLQEIVEEKQTQEWIKSYISKLTDYASDSRYISKDFTSLSYFTKDKYAVILKSYPRKDNRLFLESEVSVCDLTKSEVNFESLVTYSNMSNRMGRKEVAHKLNRAIMTALVGEYTTLYCIAADDKMINVFYSLLYSFDKQFLYNNSCVEAVGDVPPIFSPVVLCRCVEPDDYNTFKKKADQNNNCIIIDFTDSIKIEYKIDRPTFAQVCLENLLSRYDWDNVYRLMLETVRKNSRLAAEDKRIRFNALSFLCVRDNFSDHMNLLTISAQEKEELEQLLK